MSECVRMFGRRAGVFKEQVCQKKQSVKGSYVKSCQNSFFFFLSFSIWVIVQYQQCGAKGEPKKT